MKKKPPVKPVDDYGKDDPVDPAVWKEYRWGVFQMKGGIPYVNIFYSEMRYPHMIKGPFLTQEEAENARKT